MREYRIQSSDAHWYVIMAFAGTSGSPQENLHNNSSHHASDSHATQSKPADRVRHCQVLSDDIPSAFLGEIGLVLLCCMECKTFVRGTVSLSFCGDTFF